MGVPRERTAAAAYLTSFVDEIKSSGLLATLVERHGVRGLSIAVLPPR
jgi:polar amino acid transport system substrate-binding protein